MGGWLLATQVYLFICCLCQVFQVGLFFSSGLYILFALVLIRGDISHHLAQKESRFNSALVEKSCVRENPIFKKAVLFVSVFPGW